MLTFFFKFTSIKNRLAALLDHNSILHQVADRDFVDVKTQRRREIPGSDFREIGSEFSADRSNCRSKKAIETRKRTSDTRAYFSHSNDFLLRSSQRLNIARRRLVAVRTAATATATARRCRERLYRRASGRKQPSTAFTC